MLPRAHDRVQANITSTSARNLVTAAAPENCVASIGSSQDSGGFIGASLAPIVTGFIAQATGTFAAAFVVGSVIATLAALCDTVVVRRPIGESELAQVAAVRAA
jgi:cyanate permease